jgi:predicted ATPase
MTTMLTSVAASGFRSIAKVDLTLGRLNVLVGANGAGKSNFVGLFTLLGRLVERKLQLHVRQSGGPNAILTNGRKHTDQLKIDLRFGAHGYTAILVPTDANELVFESEICRSHATGNPTLHDVDAGSGYSETLLTTKAATEPVAQQVLNTMRTWRAYHFHDTSNRATIKQLGDVGDNAFLRHDAGNLAAFLLLLQATHVACYRRIVEVVRLVAPFFDDFQLRPDPYNERMIQLEWVARDTDARFGPNSFSDGTLRFACLATLLLQPSLPSLVLIDEPELGLHPYAITVLGGLLRSAATRTQVIVSTQSVTLVNQFDPENIIVVDRSAEGSVFRTLSAADTNDWMDEYSLGEIWEKNVFGGRP